MTDLFTHFLLKNLRLKNRIIMSPMCQYSAHLKDGMPSDWHFVHYSSRAVGGASLIMMEMTAVEPDGRIKDEDLGIWLDDHISAFARVAEGVHLFEAKVGIQLGHTGRKAKDAQQPLAPSPIPFGEEYKTPREFTTDEVKKTVEKFQHAARRAVAAGVDTIELHGAHGYLFHQFHSPHSNKRKDEYGQDLTRFGVEVIQAVRSEMPSEMPLLMRISGVEYMEAGYGLDYSQQFCRAYHKAGVDMFDVSSGGEAIRIPGTGIPVGVGYQVPFAKSIRQELNVPVIAVGKLEDAHAANSVIEQEEADLVAIGRGMLHDPYWALHAAQKLNHKLEPPLQYTRGF